MRTGSDRRRGGISFCAASAEREIVSVGCPRWWRWRSVSAIWLTARRSLFCWPLNLLACALYFKLFLDVRLYADMALQAAFGLGILYGWIV
jgi:hypothetical protein